MMDDPLIQRVLSTVIQDSPMNRTGFLGDRIR